MSEALDVCNAIADMVDGVTSPLVGTSYQLPADVDSTQWGLVRVVPSILVQVGRPMQQDLESRLAAGKITVTVEADVHDGPVTQFVNEGRRADLLSRDPVTLTATSTAGAWTLAGKITPGNIVGVQYGLRGAAYTVAGGDTIPAVVANLAAACALALIPAVPASSTIALPQAAVIAIGAPATYVKAVSRRLRKFGVFGWCTNPWDRQLVVRNLEPLYRQGQKFAMPDGSTMRIVEFLGTGQEDPEGNSGQRDGLYLSRSQWLIDFTVTEQFRRVPIVAATLNELGQVGELLPPLAALLSTQL